MNVPAGDPPAGGNDVVYINRIGDDNEELRYSLRSLVNLPHRSVWIVGHCPAWVTDVNVIELPPRPEKWANLHQSLTALCADERISEGFVLFNDDMYVTRPITALPVYHLGTLAGYIRHLAANGKRDSNSWFRGLKQTLAQMQEWGHPDPLCYETHSPMPYLRPELGRLLAETTRFPFLWNSAYAATSGPVGVRGANVKVSTLDEAGLARKLLSVHESGQPFLSSNDKSFAAGAVGRYVRGLFPHPGRYERVEVAA